MRVYISLDAEGCSGISRFAQVTEGSSEYAFGCERMAADVNAVIEGAKAGGATEIVVCDGHGSGRNVGISALHPAARLYTGGGGRYSMMSGVDDRFDAALFVGYHARRGAAGLMAHTYYFPSVLGVRVGGQLVGEFGINACLAGFYGVPAVFVSGDDCVAREASALAPHIYAAAVKQCEEDAANCLSGALALDVLRNAAEKAVRGAKDIPPLAASPLIEIECLLDAQAAMAAMIPGVTRQGTLVTIREADYARSFRAMIAAMMIMEAFIP